jgi:hypothetical protein
MKRTHLHVMPVIFLVISTTLDGLAISDEGSTPCLLSIRV